MKEMHRQRANKKDKKKKMLLSKIFFLASFLRMEKEDVE